MSGAARAGRTIVQLAGLRFGQIHEFLQCAGRHIGADGKVRGILPVVYAKEASRIESHYTMGWAMTGVGLAGVGVGAWLWLRNPTSAAVQVMPTGDGMLLTARF